jgi:CRISPR/Cas system-associated protein Cas7 (RAMP superfamily)
MSLRRSADIEVGGFKIFSAGCSGSLLPYCRQKRSLCNRAKSLSNDERLELVKKILGDMQKETEKRLALDGEAFDESFPAKLKSMAQSLEKIDDFKAALPNLKESLLDAMQAFNPGRLKALMRASPFASSLLVSVRRKGWEGLDNGFVHLKEGTPLPYNTEFYNTHLQGVFCLDYARLGVFWNVGDRIELDERKAERFLENGKIRVVQDQGESGKVYEMIDAATSRKTRAAALLQALAVLRGGAKQAQFGTDVSPKAYVVAGMSCGNPIFNHLFTDGGDAVTFSIDAFKEILRDYADRIVTPVFLGVRAGSVKEYDQVCRLHGWWEVKTRSESTECGMATLDGPSKERPQSGTALEVKVVTPVEAGRYMGQLLP